MRTGLRNLFCLLAFTICFIHQTNAAAAAAPSVIVAGSVYCDTCFQQEFTAFSHFIPGASVAVKCNGFQKEVKTNQHGVFKMHLQLNAASPNVDTIKSCTVKLVRSSWPFCSVASSESSAGIRLISIRNGVRVFSAGFFTFKPLRQPDVCNQKIKLSASAKYSLAGSVPKSMQSGFFFPPSISFLPSTQNIGGIPLTPNPFQPPSSILPPFPFQPSPPPFINVPPLPSIPPLPNIPPLSIPAPIPALASPPNINEIPLPPNPFQPPSSILPPFPFQPSPPPFINVPPLPNIPPLLNIPPLSTPATIPVLPSSPNINGIPLPPSLFQPPSSILPSPPNIGGIPLPPNPFQPPPSIMPPLPFQPSPPPFLNVPPLPNIPPLPILAPPPPPPASIFPPLPFPPIFPGNPPALPTQKNTP